MSHPGDFNTVTLVGTCWEVVHGLRGEIKGVTIVVDAGESALIPIIADAYPPDLARGNQLWVKGLLQTEKIGAKYLHYVKPQHLERLRL